MGEIIAHLGLNDSKFKAGVNNVGKWSKGKFAAIGTAAAGAFATTFTFGKFNEAMQRAASIREFAEQTGLTAEEFQRLDYQMRQANGTTQDVVRGMNTLDRMMARAKEGNKQAIEDFKRLGITMDELSDMSRMEVLKEFSKVVNSMDETSRGGILESLRRLLNDDAARKFIGAFQEGFEQGMADAVVMSDKVLDNAKKLTGELQKLDDTILAEFAEILSENSENIKNIITLAGGAAGGISKTVSIGQEIGSAAFPIQKAIFEKILGFLSGIERNTEKAAASGDPTNVIMGG